ncbi:MAG: PAS domain S-box protein [Rhodospirillaceae bacterium]|nr:PAS domain S-box protein [Rhodospirillaceae bacterium]
MTRVQILAEGATTSMLDGAPVMFDLISADGQLIYANETQEGTLGFAPGSLAGRKFDLIYSRESRETIWRLFEEGPKVRAEHLRLTMRHQDRRLFDVSASVNMFRDPDHGLCLRLAKFRLDETLIRLQRLEQENKVLSSIVSTARDATYCVEFIEPVDLTAPEHEVIRQIFTNKCVWRYCNEAMGRIYRLPMGEDLNKRDVREVFFRNPENETFVRQMLANGFHIDGALSRDHRYDGVDVMIENDVRARIEDGYLIQFWGVVRDLAERQRRERELEQRASAALNLLGAIPDPLLVVDFNGRIEGANTAIERTFGRALDEILGASVESMVTFPSPVAGLIKSAHTGRRARTLTGTVSCADGRRIDCEATIATVDDDAAPSRAVITFHLPRRAESAAEIERP